MNIQTTLFEQSKQLLFNIVMNFEQFIFFINNQNLFTMKPFTQFFFRNLKLSLFVLTLFFMTNKTANAQTWPNGNWELSWSDEFSGSSLNTNNWTIQTGNLGVNNELQTYTADRVSVSNGALTLFGSWDFENNRMESGRIHSQGKTTWDEGYTEARIKFEDWDWNGKDATFAAFWSMGESYGDWSNHSAHDVNGGAAWPSCGENDIMEMVPGHDAISTIHYNPSLDYNGDGDSDVQEWPHNWVYHTVSRPAPDWTQWHTFGCQKTNNELRYYLDGVYYGSHYLDDTRKEYHQPFFYILNVAIGGDLAGNPPNQYDVYVKMKVDYVRYYTPGAAVPGTIQAEDYANMSGIQVENCSEGGQNVGWFDAGDWLTYDIDVKQSGNYRVNYRVATTSWGKSLRLEAAGGSHVYGTVELPNTYWWQTWQTASHTVYLNKGYQSIGIASSTGGLNLNYIKFTRLKSSEIEELNTEAISFKVYPNPATDVINIKLNTEEPADVTIYDLSGKMILNKQHRGNNILPIYTKGLMSKGLYMINVKTKSKVFNEKILVK